jgi:hypothetical protein
MYTPTYPQHQEINITKHKVSDNACDVKSIQWTQPISMMQSSRKSTRFWDHKS